MVSPLGRRLTSIPSDTVVRTPALSRFLAGAGREAALLIHGFTGTAEEMGYLGARLQEAGLSVSIPRLPGHGTNHDDFLAVTWKDWYRRCVDEYIELAARFERVHVCGLSMGGLLALMVAAKFSPSRIALAAPALKTSNPYIGLAPIVRYFVKSVGGREDGKPEEPDPDHDALENEYKSRHWIGPIAELRALQRIARSLLAQVRSDTLTIVSRADRTVPASVADLVERCVPAREKRRLVLEGSGHVVVDDVERDRVAGEITAWFTR